MERECIKSLGGLSHFLAPAGEGAAPPHGLAMDTGGGFVQPQFQIPGSLAHTLEIHSQDGTITNLSAMGGERNRLRGTGPHNRRQRMGTNSSRGETGAKNRTAA